jgi:hypothetical protein
MSPKRWLIIRFDEQDVFTAGQKSPHFREHHFGKTMSYHRGINTNRAG